MTKLKCPVCGSKSIDQYRMRTGAIWCKDCGFKSPKKEKYNPFTIRDEESPQSKIHTNKKPTTPCSVCGTEVYFSYPTIEYNHKVVCHNCAQSISAMLDVLFENTEKNVDINIVMDMIKLLKEFKKGTKFYKNCRTNRKREAKICQDCSFRHIIESIEMFRDNFNEIKD
jgi:predicted RNA-binding Zn-ribbon protein involved in translation (DUF1610 family)